MNMSPLLDLPANARLLTISSAGSQLAVLEVLPVGEPVATVQLVHGFTGSKEDFWELSMLLAQSGYRVIAHDHRGHNQSSHADISTYTIDQFAQDVITIQEALDIDEVHLLGHSFGGMVARLAAIKAPTKFKSFTLFCTGPTATLQIQDLVNLRDFMRGKTMAETWNSLKQNPKAEITFRPSDDWPQHIQKRWAATDPNSLMATVDMIVDEIDRTDLLKSTGINCHAVYGEFDDAWTPLQQDEVAAQLGAPVSVIAGCGHCPNEEDPIQTAKVLCEFWTKH
jgi:pimeloyl-ACP methyl ester carboxylesterase